MQLIVCPPADNNWPLAPHAPRIRIEVMRGEPLSWQSHFTSVQTESASVNPAALERARTELGAELGMPEPFVLPELLADMLGAGVSSCSRSVGGQDSEFGWLGTAMADMYRSYELETYMPHAVPIAFDGGGGFYLLDARGGKMTVASRSSGLIPAVSRGTTANTVWWPATSIL
jgi:hypothetical protein